VLVELGSLAMLLRVGRRQDEGLAACVTGNVLEGVGGDGVEVAYRAIGFWGRVTRDKGLALQLAVAILTWLGAGFSVYGTWLKSTASTATSWEQKTAVIVFAIAAVLATLKFFQDLRDL
jgi:hypothetical protein